MKTRVASVLLCCLLSGNFVLGQAVTNSDSGPELPTARQVIEKYVEARGGEMMLRGMESVRILGHIEQQEGAIGVNTIEFLWKESGWTTIYNYPGNSKLFIGKSEGRVWKMSPGGTDPEWVSEQESQTYNNINRDPLLAFQWLDFDGKITVEDIEPVGDEDAYRLVFEYADGAEITRWFAVESGLHVKTKFLMNGTRVIGQSSDYRVIEGIPFAFKEYNQYPDVGIEFDLIIDEVEVNAAVDDADVELPESLRGDGKETERDDP